MEQQMNKIAVLLSSYNGYEYIEEQIDSICKQKNVDFTLYIRDDGSEKEFVELLCGLQKKYDFKLLKEKNIGFLKSFMEFLAAVDDADLYAFSDQDDIWSESKLEIAEQWFQKQNSYDSIPLLYHSAYDLVERGKKVGHFYFPDAGYDFRRSITENHFSGFSMVINRKMREMMLQGDRDQIGYHDWWAAMIAQAFGKSFSDVKTEAEHRVHGDNVTTFNIKTRLKWLKKNLCETSEIKKRSCEFERCFKNMMSDKDIRTLAMFTQEKYSLRQSLKKAFYPKRWRPAISSEITIRLLMLLGRV